MFKPYNTQAREVGVRVKVDACGRFYVPAMVQSKLEVVKGDHYDVFQTIEGAIIFKPVVK